MPDIGSVRMRRDKASRPWHLYVLGLVAIALVVLAVLEIGPPSSSGRTSREVITAQAGVVQSTVSASGNIAAGTDVDVNFRAGGTLQAVYVTVGQHVTQGQLLATLNPAAAQLQLDQAQESLTSAQDQLTAVENGTASGSSASASATNSSATPTSFTGGQTTDYVSDTTFKPAAATTPTRSTPTTPHTTPTPTTPAATSRSSGSRSSSSSTSSSSGRSGSSSGTANTTTTTTPSPASIASAQASVYSAEANLQNAQTALNNTRLYAPTSGTIVSMANLLPGDTVSAGSSANATSASGSSSSSGGAAGGGAAAGGTSTAGSLGGSGSSSSSGGSSSSPFAEIVDTGTMTMSVAFSESDISKIKVNQPATVSLDALPGVQLAAHVAQISTVGTTSSGVVSYSATLALNQSDSRVKPGMSASASVIVGQAQGVTVPNAAVTGTGSLGTVNVLQNGKTVQRSVIVGLRGDSNTQIISGLSAGQQLVVTISLPSLNSSPTSTTGSSGTLGGGGLGGGAGGLFRGGGGGFFGGGGAGAFFRGGGG